MDGLRKALNRKNYAELLDAVFSSPSWDLEGVEQVSEFLITRAERALSTPLQEASAALYDLIGRLRSAHGEEVIERLRPGTLSSWRTIEEILDERLARLKESGE